MDGLSEGSHKVIIKHPWNCSEFTPIFSQGPPTPPMPLVPVPFRSPSRSSGPCGHRCLDVLFSFQIHFHRGKKDQLNEGSSSSWEEFLNLKCTLQRGFLDLLVTFHINAPPSALQAPSPPAWFSVNAKCWLGAWRSQHLRQNWVGLFRVPQSTISETCWRGTAMMIFGRPHWSSGLFQFINLKVKLGRCPKNQHVVQLLRMVLYIPLNLWLMVNMMALSRVPPRFVSPPTALHWNRPRKNWPSHPLRKRPPFFWWSLYNHPHNWRMLLYVEKETISWSSSVHRTVASIFSLENVKLSIGQTSELVQYGIFSSVIYVIHKTHRAQCCLTRRSIAIWRRQTTRQTSESATTSWTTTDQVPMLLSSKKLPQRRGRLRVPNWLHKRGLIWCIQYFKHVRLKTNTCWWLQSIDLKRNLVKIYYLIQYFSNKQTPPKYICSLLHHIIYNLCKN